jgi:hypothetical protein
MTINFKFQIGIVERRIKQNTGRDRPLTFVEPKFRETTRLFSYNDAKPVAIISIMTLRKIGLPAFLRRATCNMRISDFIRVPEICLYFFFFVLFPHN